MKYELFDPIFRIAISRPPHPPSQTAWLRRQIRRRCQCFALWDAVSMVTLAPMECVLSATRNICRDNKVGGETVPQVRKVNQSFSVKCTYCIQNLICSLSFEVQKSSWFRSSLSVSSSGHISCRFPRCVCSDSGVHPCTPYGSRYPA